MVVIPLEVHLKAYTVQASLDRGFGCGTNLETPHIVSDIGLLSRERLRFLLAPRQVPESKVKTRTPHCI